MHLSPHWGPEDPRGVQSILYVRPFFRLSVSLYLCPVICVAFWSSFSRTIIAHIFLRILKYLYESRNIRGGQRIRIYKYIHILSLYWCPKYPSGVQSKLYVHISVCLSLRLSISLSLSPFVHIDFWRFFAWPIIAHSACGRRTRVQIPLVVV